MLKIEIPLVALVSHAKHCESHKAKEGLHPPPGQCQQTRQDFHSLTGPGTLKGKRLCVARSGSGTYEIAEADTIDGLLSVEGLGGALSFVTQDPCTAHGWSANGNGNTGASWRRLDK